MKKLFLVAALAATLSTPAIAYEPERAAANASHEFVTCSAYYFIVSGSLSQTSSKPEWLELGEAYKTQAQAGMQYARIFSNDETVLARLQEEMDIQLEAIDNNYSNVVRIRVKHGKACKGVFDDPAGRVQYWLDKED